ncbi:PilZ domain-containing protein [bacterium]|nr:MAG: PilZ domain-containing protein [bacterium]
MNKIQNKRSFIRLSAYHIVKYKPLSTENQEAIPVFATIKDIGAGGVCLRTEEYLPVSSTIELKINFPFRATPIFTIAKVVWIKKRDQGRHYEVGAQFMEIEDSARRLIDQHLKYALKNIKEENIWHSVFRKGGDLMGKLSKILVILALLSVLAALSIKLTIAGRILPGPLPINWAKLADTLLLFSIALSLLGKK